MARVYATRAELADYAPAGVTVPEDPEATRQLTRASERIQLATRTAVYDTDTGGMPTDPDVVDALRHAVCALVVHWLITGDEDGEADAYGSVSIGSISLSRSSSGSRGSSDRGGGQLPEAVRTHLELAGLLRGVIYHR